MIIEEFGMEFGAGLAEMVYSERPSLYRCCPVDATRAGHLVGKALPESKYLPCVIASRNFPIQIEAIHIGTEIDDGVFIYYHLRRRVRAVTLGFYDSRYRELASSTGPGSISMKAQTFYYPASNHTLQVSFLSIGETMHEPTTGEQGTSKILRLWDGSYN